MTRRRTRLAVMLTVGMSVAACGERAGDSGGAASGDSLPGGTGSARTHDSLESMRPRDTTLPSQVPDSRGRDTT